MSNVHIGDDVSLNAKVVTVSVSGNPVIEFKSGVRVLVRESDLNTIHPYTPIPEVDERKGK